MGVTLIETCQVKTSLFATCGDEKAAVCQYCARRFCQRHGSVFADDEGIRQEVCTRKVCVAKRDDLLRHYLYRDAVSRRNDRRACGIETCAADLAAQCVRCKGLFCEDHVRKREETVFENQVKVPRLANLCQHCWARRPIWLKT
jgi:hypothetical protein